MKCLEEELSVSESLRGAVWVGSTLPAFSIRTSLFLWTIIQGNEQVLGQLRVIACERRNLAHFLPHAVSPSSHQGQQGTKAFTVPVVLLVPLRDIWLKIQTSGLPAGEEPYNWG